jgi:hypothetical protein
LKQRDWSDAREKVEREGRCRVCGCRDGLQFAHILGRRYDDANGWVDPLHGVPLCGGPLGRPTCHVLYDERRLDLSGYLTPEELAEAVAMAGEVSAMRRITGSREAACPT